MHLDNMLHIHDKNSYELYEHLKKLSNMFTGDISLYKEFFF